MGLLSQAVLMLAVALPLGGSAAAQGASGDVKAAVQSLVSAYSANDSSGFLRLFNEDAFSGFQDYAENIRDFLRDNRQINIRVIFDYAVEDQGRLAANIRWNKSLVTKAGRQVLSSGKCELVFGRVADQSLRLSAIHGRSPF